MADITTSGGYACAFNPEEIVSILDPDPQTNDTAILGLLKPELKTQESAAALLARVGLLGHFVKLTAFDTTVWIKAKAVRLMMPAIQSPLDDPRVKTWVCVGEAQYKVLEDLSTARAALNGAGATL